MKGASTEERKIEFWDRFATLIDAMLALQHLAAESQSKEWDANVTNMKKFADALTYIHHQIFNIPAWYFKLRQGRTIVTQTF